MKLFTFLVLVGVACFLASGAKISGPEETSQLPEEEKRILEVPKEPVTEPELEPETEPWIEAKDRTKTEEPLWDEDKERDEKIRRPLEVISPPSRS